MEELPDARAGKRTAVHYESSIGGALPQPPAGVFARITYPSAVGPLGAYLTLDPGDGVRRPAIIWMTGGETNTVGDVWTAAPRENDQTAAAYRQAGIVMMFPSLRGGNDNPERIEGFFGEIDDILSAAEFLANQPHVDPARIYLGGHSTGGTLVFLTAAASDRFRAVFAFGPVARASSYGQDLIPDDFRRLPRWEERLRAPEDWMGSVRGPLFVIEGGDLFGNREDLRAMRAANTNPNLHFIEVPDAGHFNVLAPANEVIARAILADTGAHSSIALTEQELAAAMPQRVQAPGRLDAPRWVRRPHGDQMLALYPADALKAGIEGSVGLRCIVQANLRLGECTIVREEPPGHGFGAAAIQAAEQYFEMSPTTGDGRSAVGSAVSLPISWRLAS